MSDSFGANGLQVSTQQELLNELVANYQNIYGSDINLDQSSPDGQVVNILAQAQSDIRGILLQIYNSFDPDNASGRVLDERCAINNVFRKGGTYTTVDITIVTDRTVTLQGLDGEYNNPLGTGYTIQDDAGNRFILANTQTLSAGTSTLLFRAEQIGAVETQLNTITNQVTVVLGVVSVNNPVASTVGQNEETDAQLKIRRRKSVAIGSSGYLNGLLAKVLQLTGVVDAALYENYTSETDSLGIPPHCIWLIVEGGSSEDIANTLYSTKSYGCNMRGNITYTITTPSRQLFIARWDEPTIQPLYMKFKLQALEENITFDIDAIKNYILSNTSFNIGGYASTSSLTAIAQMAINNSAGSAFGEIDTVAGVALEVQISTDNSNWVEFAQSNPSEKFALTDVQITEVAI